MGLGEYQRKRNFRSTPEPVGKKVKKKGWSYVIHKHDARRLHYDFRLELDGVLKSWAVPKGPSLDPAEKRLAVQVEDHPLEYGRFEGIIPQGEYGGGTVMLWDRGYWEPVGDPQAGYRQGHLKFTLHGEKLRGGFVLVRSTSPAFGGGKNNWLLIKHRDQFAKPLKDGSVLAESLSVATQRDMEAIAAAADRVWQSNARAATRRAPPKRKAPSIGRLRGAKAAKLPSTIKPQLAMLSKRAPDGDEWLHEMKFDGYRVFCRIDQGRVKLIGRDQKDWSGRFPFLVQAAQDLPVKQAMLDGEIVAMKPDGTTDLQLLRKALREGRVQDLAYYVFDLVHYNGRSLLKVPLEERKRVLSEILTAGDQGPIRFSDHVIGNGPVFFEQACKLGLEGVISKRRSRPYVPGRGRDWLKTRANAGERRRKASTRK